MAVLCGAALPLNTCTARSPAVEARSKPRVNGAPAFTLSVLPNMTVGKTSGP